jgi:C-terminal processing protease CtpA/Prc
VIRQWTSGERLSLLRTQSFGFGRIERMGGNVAHMVIQSFPHADGEYARNGIESAMAEIADADALLLDLRENVGGSPDTIALVASYLFDASPVHIDDILGRAPASLKQYWTLGPVRGARFGSKKPVYVLTSKETVGGGEELAYDLQCLRRALVVGERTRGFAYPVSVRDLDEWFRIVVPSERPVNPITKANWAGAGVAPNIPVSAEAALDEAYRRALGDVARLDTRSRRDDPRR